MVWSGEPSTSIPSPSELPRPLPEITYLPLGRGRRSISGVDKASLQVAATRLGAESFKVWCGCDLCPTLLPGPLALLPGCWSCARAEIATLLPGQIAKTGILSGCYFSYK